MCSLLLCCNRYAATHTKVLPGADPTSVSECTRTARVTGSDGSQLRQLFDGDRVTLECWPLSYALVAVTPVARVDPDGACLHTNHTYRHLTTMSSLLVGSSLYLHGKTMTAMPSEYLTATLPRVLGHLTCNSVEIRPEVWLCV